MSELLLYIVFFLTALFVYNFFIRKTRADKILAKIKGPVIFPLIGNFLAFAGPQEDTFYKLLGMCKCYGKRFRTYIAGSYFVMLSDPVDVEKILTSQVNLEKGLDYDLIKPWLGTGLLTSKGEKWFRRRKMLTPTFHFKILEDFMSVFNEHSLTMVKIFKEECTNGVFDVNPYITRCTLDIICETAMGKRVYAQTERSSNYCSNIVRMGKLMQLRSLTPWYRPEFLWNLTKHSKEQIKVLENLHGFTENVIKERKSELASKPRDGDTKTDDPFQGKIKLAFMDMLLEEQQKNPDLTDLDIREETDTFMFEGHDTTATSLNFTLFVLGCYPEIQAKVHAELDEIFGSDRTRPITSKDLTQMKYLECVIKESLRLYPSVPFIERILEKDVILDDGQILPRGTTAFVVIFQMHRNADIFEDPDDFKPERFLLDNIDAKRNPFAYIPFSAGPRNCIGQKFAMMEEKVILSNVLRNFTITAGETRNDLTLLAEMVLRSHHGIKISLKSR